MLRRCLWQLPEHGQAIVAKHGSLVGVRAPSHTLLHNACGDSNGVGVNVKEQGKTSQLSLDYLTPMSQCPD